MKRQLIHRCRHFFSTTLWQNTTGKPIYGTLIQGIRIACLAARGFKVHHGSLRASALTFYTLLSLVPVMAMAFGVAKGFGFERLLEKELLKYFSSQQEVIIQLIDFARNMLDNTKGGLIAGVGIFVLFLSVIKVLSNIEESFNHIWQAPPRSWPRKVSDYLSITIIAPLFLIISGSATVYAVSQVMALSSQVGLEKLASPAMSLGLILAPYFILWILFTLLYLIMPNTKIRISSVLPAALLTGSMYQFMQIAYVKFQITMTSYNAIYGSFAALPLFLIWLNLSWYIVLFGAEIAYATQNSNKLDSWQENQNISPRQIKFLAVAMASQAAYIFQQGLSPHTPQQLGQILEIPAGLSLSLANLLVQAQILSRLDDGSTSYPVQPARDISTLRITQVLAALDTVGHTFSLTGPESRLASLEGILQNLEHDLESSTANELLPTIAQKFPHNIVGNI